MSDEEEEEEIDEDDQGDEDEVDEDDSPQEEDQKNKNKETDQFNEFSKYTPYSQYAKLSNTYQNNNSQFNYNQNEQQQQQQSIPYQPASYWADKVQYHQQEINRAKNVLNGMQKHPQYPYHNTLNQNTLSQDQFHPYNYRPNYDSQSTLQNRYLQQPYQNYNQIYNPYQNEQIYQQPQEYQMQNQFNYNQKPQFQEQQSLNYSQTYNPQIELDRSQRIQITKQNDMPIGVSQYQPEKPNGVTQNQMNYLNDNEREYQEFLQFKETIKRQQQMIEDQEFLEFMEFRKIKEQQILQQSIQRDQEKRSVTDLYRRKNRQVFSEEEFRSLASKRNYEQQMTTTPIQIQDSKDIDKAIQILLQRTQYN